MHSWWPSILNTCRMIVGSIVTQVEALRAGQFFVVTGLPGHNSPFDLSYFGSDN